MIFSTKGGGEEEEKRGKRRKGKREEKGKFELRLSSLMCL